MSYSKNAGSKNFIKKQNLVPWIEEQLEMQFQQLSNDTTYFSIVTKQLKPNFNVQLFSNAGAKVLTHVGSMAQIYPIVCLLFRTLNLGLKNTFILICCSTSFAAMLKYVLSLETCQKFIQCVIVLQLRGQGSNSF